MTFDPQFMIHNSHLEDLAEFSERDPQLKRLNKQIYAYTSPLVSQLPVKNPGIYTITGGRQIGKTTCAKQWMLHLLNEGVSPQCIVYFTGEIIMDHFFLIRQIQSYLQKMPKNLLHYMIVDEVTYINNWDMGVKFLADAGLLENVILILTGSDLAIIREARMRFPGRRGTANQVDYHLHPLSFYEFLKLTKAIEDLEAIVASETISSNISTKFQKPFEEYLIHGGYLTAINDFAKDKRINKNTLDTYSDWVRGDVVKRGKKDAYCREFFTAMIKRQNSQITWNALAKDFSIDHHATVADYADLLMSMDAIFIQKALQEDRLTGAPKKARKLIFTDPFIYHAIVSWLNPSQDPFGDNILRDINDSKTASYLVESCVVSHFSRWYSTYYIKAEGEVDVAYIKNKKFWPIEVKWTEQMRSKDLKQIQKYKNGIVLSKQQDIGKINTTPSFPLPWYLAKIAYENDSF